MFAALRGAPSEAYVAIRDAVLPPVNCPLAIIDIDELGEPRMDGRVVTVGLAASAHYSAGDIECDLDGTSFTLKGRTIRLSLIGERNVIPALAAIATAVEAGVALDEAIAAVEAVHSTDADLSAASWGGITVIDDSHDRGSRSTVEALKTLAEVTGESRRSIAILGELDGLAAPESRDEHDRIGRIVVRLNIAKLIVVGDGARILASAAGLEGSWDGESVLVATAAEAYDLLRAEIREGDIVLVKVPMLAARLSGALA